VIRPDVLNDGARTVAGSFITTMMIRAGEDWMEQEAERVDGPDSNVVPLNDVLRRRRSPAEVSRPKTEAAVPPEDDEPLHDAA
jgi:hypothetical protein